ncbi:MAG TPA: proteasome accessory factor PafA2 family protein [Armatimonadota bacterium]|jgi:proteasome accessory factor A
MYGIETEYGIHVEGKGASDMVSEARAVVRAYRGRFAAPWNYGAESPRHDMRGFEVARLTHDATDAQFERGSAHFASATDERSDRVLPNGARLYNDHGHPEYATPECRSLQDLVAQDRAGERILFQCALERAVEGAAVTLYKNNTDFHGASYGCHEGYLASREVPFEELKAAMLPFLVTRQIYAGAGKVGVEPAVRTDCSFQLSQRADFISEEASVDTLARRPIFNTRDEPHADARRYRRVHVIVGDANMSEMATALKVGATALALRLLESGWRPNLTLQNPVKAIRDISRDPTRAWRVELEGHRTISAVDIQRVYCEEALDCLTGLPEDLRWAGEEWRRTLGLLESDPMALSDRVDWVAKLRLLDAFREEERLEWSDPMMTSLDLAYSDIDPEAGLYHGLEQDGHAARLVDDAAVERAMLTPPEDTRAAVRGAFVERFPEEIEAISWGGIALKNGSGRTVVELGITNAETSRDLAARVRRASSAREAADLLKA